MVHGGQRSVSVVSPYLPFGDSIFCLAATYNVYNFVCDAYIMSLFICVLVHKWVRVDACTCGGHRLTLYVLFHHFFTLYCETVSLKEPVIDLVTDWSTSLGDSVCLCLRYESTLSQSAFTWVLRTELRFSRQTLYQQGHGRFSLSVYLSLCPCVRACAMTHVVKDVRSYLP